MSNQPYQIQDDAPALTVNARSLIQNRSLTFN